MWGRPASPLGTYLLGRQQQALDGLKVLEELSLLNDVDVILEADGFVQGAPVCKVKAARQSPGGGDGAGAVGHSSKQPPFCLPLLPPTGGLETDDVFALDPQREESLAK